MTWGQNLWTLGPVSVVIWNGFRTVYYNVAVFQIPRDHGLRDLMSWGIYLENACLDLL